MITFGKNRSSSYLVNSYLAVLGTLFLTLCALLSAPSAAYAQVSIRAEVSPKSGALSDVYLFTVTVDGSERSPAPLLSGGDDFNLELVGPQTSISIVNGHVTARSSYVYRLSPKHAGELTTPAAEVEIGGKRYSTDPLPVTVSKSAVPNAEPPSGGDRLFIRQTATPVEAYQGQQIVNAVTVYTRIELREPQLNDLTTDGFWQETLSDEERSTKRVNGYNYTSVQVRKALYPLRSGQIDLPSRKLSAKIADPRGRKGFSDFDPFQDDFFQQFFGGGPLQEVTVTSNDLQVEVKSLPAAPSDLQPLLGPVTIVGPTTIKVDYSPDVINVGESKAVTVEVSSEGNLNPLKSLNINAPAGIKVYDERPGTKMLTGGQKLIMKKTFRYSLVPLKPGLFRLPGVRIAYFDPNSATYRIATSPDIAFAVQGTAVTSSPQATPAATQQQQTPTKPKAPAAVPTLSSIPPVGPPLRYEEPTFLEKVNQGMSVQLGLLLLAAAIFLWTLVTLASRIKRPLSATAISVEEIRTAEDIRTLEELLRKLLASKLPISSGSSVEQIRAITAKEIKDRDTALVIASTLDDLEVLRYGKAEEVSPREIEGLKTRLLEILARL